MEENSGKVSNFQLRFVIAWISFKRATVERNGVKFGHRGKHPVYTGYF